MRNLLVRCECEDIKPRHAIKWFVFLAVYIIGLTLIAAHFGIQLQ